MGGLIVAIGAQNAFLLRQALQRHNVKLLVALATAFDTTLVIAGVAGFGAFVHTHPALLLFVSWTGAVFLLAYGTLALRRAIKPSSLTLGDSNGLTAWQAARSLAAVSLLNPHVYLDTVVVVGGIAGNYGGVPRLAYTLGAIAASASWFSLLGFGAVKLAPIFANPLAWRVLDGLIALIMFAITAGLIQSVLT